MLAHLASNTLTLLLVIAPILSAEEPIRALIVDGQNNHDVWPKTSMMMRDYLEQTEKLEQLRALWLGMEIRVAVAPEAHGPDVDTPEDLAAAANYLAATGSDA